MIQLILDTDGLNVELPESTRDRYWAELVPQSTDVEMISGRLVKELRADVWEVHYQYEYMAEDLKNSVLAVIKKAHSQPIVCSFLPPDSQWEIKKSKFWVQSFTYPKYKWVKQNGGREVPLWADMALTLREVKPDAGGN